MKFDLHMHTFRYSPDSVIDPFELVARAQEIGLDGVVITEHDVLWPEEELEELRAAAPGLVVLGGVEITGTQGDVLCYGVRDVSGLPRGVDWNDLCAVVHAQGGACVAAHPNRWEQPFDDILRDDEPELDGIEVLSNNMDDDLRILAQGLMRRHPNFATLGNSDAHQIDVLGVCYTEFDARITDNASLVAAIRGRKGTAKIRA